MSKALEAVQSDQPSYGHYTAFIYRRGNTGWMEVDDMKDKSKFVHENIQIVPRLIIFVKTNVEQ